MSKRRKSPAAKSTGPAAPSSVVENAGPNAAPDPEFAVVAFGASAGSIEVLKHIVSVLQPEWNAAYVVALHMSPRQPSQLVEILQNRSPVQVVAARDGIDLVPGRVYVVPPNTHMRFRRQQVVLEPADGPTVPKPSVDTLFASLATELADRAIAVVLSGTGSDGSQGIQAVKDVGGITMVQDPQFCEHAGMPSAALATGSVDLKVAPENIADVVGSIVQPAGGHTAREVEPDDEFHRAAILASLSAGTGIKFNYVKEPTLTRRIRRRQAIVSLSRLSDYSARVAADPLEARALAQSILVSVTSFFRDPTAFMEFRRTLELYARRQAGRPGALRLWVTACASGEEAYSVAMLMQEIAEHAGRPIDYTIFASDLDEQAIEHARQGVYRATALQGLPPEFAEKYFVRKGDEVRVRDSLRRHIVFSVHNLMSDPPFSNLDVVSCRNFLIYVRTEFQRSVTEMLHYALRPDGLLFLGRSEQPGGGAELFRTVSQEHRIYSRAPGPGAGRAVLGERSGRSAPQGPFGQAGQRQKRSEAFAREVFELASMTLAREHVRAWLVVDRHDIIKYVSDGARPFLRIPSGPAILRIYDSLLPEVTLDLRGLIFRARREKTLVTGYRAQCTVAGERLALKPHIMPILQAAEDLLLIVLEVESQQVTDEAGQPRAVGDAEYVREMEMRLQQLQQDLRSVSEELETSNEELQSQSEELQSSNEELQSMNEQLLTSNEELQSSNEELTTLNDELRAKSDAFAEAAERMSELSRALPLPVLFFDQHLRLASCSAASATLFSRPPVVGSAAHALPWNAEALLLLESLRACVDAKKELEVGYGKPLRFRGSVRSIMAQHGGPVGAMVVLTPVADGR